MLTLTPEVLDLFTWFELTHELTATFGGVWWQMVRLPGEGSVGQQDARLMAALDVVCEVQNALLHEQQRKGDPDAERTAFHEQTRREREQKEREQ